MKQTFLILIILTLTITPAFGDVAGPLSPTMVSQEEGESLPDSVKWKNLSNVLASDDKYATVTLNEPGFKEGRTSYLLRVTGFGFRVPESATILGIEARIEKRAEGSGIRDLGLQLIKGGVITGSIAADSTNAWPVIADDVHLHGGLTSLWGLNYRGQTPTPAEVNSPDFGMAICAAHHLSADMQLEAGIDHIQMVVYYSLPIIPKQMSHFDDSELDLLATLQTGQFCYRQIRAPEH